MLPYMHYGLLFFGLQVRIISEFAVYGVFTYLEVWVVNFLQFLCDLYVGFKQFLMLHLFVD